MFSNPLKNIRELKKSKFSLHFLSIKKMQTLVLMTSLFIPFQNCSPAFKTGAESSTQSATGSTSEITKPQVALVKPPASLSNVRSMNLVIKALPDARTVIASISCQLDANPPTDCIHLNFSVYDLSDGEHAIKLGATDDRGNVSEPMLYNFKVDGTAPVVNISSAPAAVVGSTAAIFTFTATDAYSTIRSIVCSRDGSAFITCSSPLSLSGLSVGKHTIRIKAIDAAGNDSVEKVVDWSIDLSAPVLSYSTKPNAFMNSKTANLAFSGTLGGTALSNFQCSLDGAAFATCTSPQSISNSADGNHTFSIRGVNPQGLASAALIVNWIVDTIAPSAPTVNANVGTSTTLAEASFSFSSTDSGSMISSYQCALDGSIFATCTSPIAFTSLNGGNHSFQVRAYDSAGNVSAAGSFSWMIALPITNLDGKTLFANNCAACHNGADYYAAGRSAKDGRTAAQITAAIGSISAMSSLKGLSSSQIQAISNYLKVTVPTTLACATDFKPERTPMRMLSHSEYDNIATDVFLSKMRPSVIAKFVKSSAGSSGFSNTTVTSEPNSPVINEIMVEKYLTAAQLIADELIANKTNVGSGYSSLAACAVGQTSIAEACYDNIVRELGLKVWRRPISEVSTDNEFARLKGLLKTGSFDSGFKTLIKALLMSPHFLTVNFTSSTPVVAGAAYNLNDYQLASRLAFFLWTSTPDAALLSAAKLGTLSQSANLQQQVLRMTKDFKAKRFSSRMTNEWLEVGGITDLGILGVDPSTIAAMVNETQYFFEDIVKNDTSLLNTLSANYSLLNKSLADYYGVPFTGADPAGFYKTSLAATPRRGVLNQAAFLIATAGGNDKTHPVVRGKLVSNRIGCYEIAPPPASLDISLPPTLPQNATPREILAIHTQRVSCAGCHNTLDPFGLPLESYDSRGNWRSKYVEIADRPILTDGVLPTGESFNDTVQFMTVIANTESIRSCVVKKVMAAGLARRVASVDDRCISSQISTSDMTSTSKFSELIFNVVNSRQFKMQTTEGL